MANSSLLTDYLGRGIAAARPASLIIASGALALWHSTDTGETDWWNGGGWSALTPLPTIPAGELFGNFGTAAAVPSAVPIGAGLENAAGTLVADWQGGSVTSPGTLGQILTSTGAGSAPTFQGGIYVIAGFSGSTPMLPNQVLFGHQFSAPVTYPANFGATAQGPASKGGAFIAAAGSTVINIDQCAAASDPTNSASWSTVGTMTVASAGHSVTFATTSGAAPNFALGDYMRWIVPTPDALLANFFASLAGTRA
jgi:hypothetical protein